MMPEREICELLDRLDRQGVPGPADNPDRRKVIQDLVLYPDRVLCSIDGHPERTKLFRASNPAWVVWRWLGIK